MSAVLAAAFVLAPQNQPGVKHWILDDFTVGAYTVTLQYGQFDSHVVFDLDKWHCAFGERRTQLHINNNVNQTTLTLSIGNGAQAFSSPKQVAWEYYLKYGADGVVDIDLSTVDRFIFDLDQIPDIVSMSVMDIHGNGGGNGGALGHPKGIYFRRAAFSGNVDWKHIWYLGVRQDFTSFPNPLNYTVTRFYATVKPGPVGPASNR